jgi:capsular polysaccharide biosynthesis protein
MMTLGNEQFVAELYRELLFREADAAGMRHHLNLLEKGMSRIRMLACIMKSVEAEQYYGRRSVPHPKTISTVADWARSFGGEAAYGLPLFEPVEREEDCVRPPAKSWNGSSHWVFEHLSQNVPPEQFIARIPNGRVCGDANATITPDNRLLQDVSFEYRLLPIEQHSIFWKPELPPIVHYSGTVALLSSNASYNYYHWMMEVAARIHLLSYGGVEIDKVVLNPFTQPFQQEILDMLGLPRDKIIFISESTHLEADLLIVPSFGSYTGVPPRWPNYYLKNALKDALTNTLRTPLSTGYGRVYVSRARATYRQVRNEDRIVYMLNRYGFVVAYLEEMSVAEQIRLFHSARIIIAPHGAGLTNVMFCEPNAAVIELSSPRFVSPLYYYMSVASALDYYYLVGEEEIPLGKEWDHGIHADMYIDVGKLEALVLQAIEEGR